MRINSNFYIQGTAEYDNGLRDISFVKIVLIGTSQIFVKDLKKLIRASKWCPRALKKYSKMKILYFFLLLGLQASVQKRLNVPILRKDQIELQKDARYARKVAQLN